MLTIGFLYLNLGLAVVAGLTVMILRVGAIVGDCPQTQARAGAAAVPIATGFAAIGGGAVVVIGAGLAAAPQAPLPALMLCLGFAAICLGLGFAHAMHLLRANLVPHPDGT